MNISPKKQIKGYQALIASALAFSLMGVCVKHIGNKIPVAEIVFARALISLLITRITLRKSGISPWGKNKKLLLIRGLIGTGALFCIFKAISVLPLGIATVIQYTYPTFTSIFACFLLGEELKKRIILAVILGWIGITLIVKTDGLDITSIDINSLNFYIALSGSLLTSLAYILVRKLSEYEHLA